MVKQKQNLLITYFLLFSLKEALVRTPPPPGPPPPGPPPSPEMQDQQSLLMMKYDDDTTNNRNMNDDADFDDADDNGDDDEDESVLRIVGGQLSPTDDWSFMAAVFHRYPNGYYSLFCGGVVWNANTIVTAAHCLYSSRNNRTLRLSEETYVYIGHTDVSNIDHTYMLKAKKLIPHENYSNETIIRFMWNDVGLIKLSEPIDFKRKHIGTTCVCQPEEAETDNTLSSTESSYADNPTKPLCITMGWGLTSNKPRKGPDLRKMSTKLREVQVPIQPRIMCEMYGDNNYNHDIQLCAGFNKGGHDSCQGDSGGPLMCPAGGLSSTTSKLEVSKVYHFTGIVSFGHDGCGSAMRPAIYTRASAFIPWITRHTGCDSTHLWQSKE